MHQEFWHDKWKTKDIKFDQPQPNQLLQKYSYKLDLKFTDRVFVPLCGKSVDMIWLIKQGYEVLGVELSPIACELFFHENNIPVNITETDNYTIFQGEKITLLSGDFFQLTKETLGKVDAVYDRAALIALPIDLRQLYTKHLANLLKPNTPILLITMLYNVNEMEGPPFSINEDEVKMLYGNNFHIQQLESKVMQSMPDHLKNKGVTQVSEPVYYLR